MLSNGAANLDTWAQGLRFPKGRRSGRRIRPPSGSEPLKPPALAQCSNLHRPLKMESRLYSSRSTSAIVAAVIHGGMSIEREDEVRHFRMHDAAWKS